LIRVSTNKMAFNNQPDWADYNMKVQPEEEEEEEEDDNMEYTRYYDDDGVSHYVNDDDDNIILDDGLGLREGWRFDEEKLIIYTDTGEEIKVFPYH